MIIKGQNIVLRAIEPEDAELLFKLINDPETEYLLGGWSFPVSQKDQLDWIVSLSRDNSNLRCMIQINETSEAVGTVILNNIDCKNGTAAIHIKIAGNAHKGKGYGTEAINTLVDYGFNELRLHCIYAQVNEDNIPSQKLFQKCGFIPEGILKDRLHKKGKYLSVKMFSILNSRI